MPLTRETKEAIITDYAVEDGDTGSPEVQIALLTGRIKDLTGHLQRFPRTTTRAAASSSSSGSDVVSWRTSYARTTRATAPSSHGWGCAASRHPAGAERHHTNGSRQPALSVRTPGPRSSSTCQGPSSESWRTDVSHALN